MKSLLGSALAPILLCVVYTTAHAGGETAPAPLPPAAPADSKPVFVEGLLPGAGVVPQGTAQAVDYTGLQAGASIYMIRPYLNNNNAFTTTTGLNGPSPSQTSQDFRWDYQPAFDAWLGWTAPSGVGFRARYFHFDESSQNLNAALTPTQAATTTIAGPTTLTNLPGANFGTPGIVLGSGLGNAGLTFGSDLHVDSWDMEATFACKACQFSGLISGGARYLHLAQDYSAALTNTAITPGGTISETQLLRSGHNFDGAGPTLACFGRYEIGRTGLAFVGTVRGSLLVGSGREDTSFFQKIVDPTGAAGGNQTVNPTRTSTFDQVLPVLELDLGVEYGLNLRNSRFFVRGGVVDQTYFGAGNASSNSGNFSLFGGKLALGINY